MPAAQPNCSCVRLSCRLCAQNSSRSSEGAQLTRTLELLLTTDGKCLEREQLKEVRLREQEGELEAEASGK